jgi:predicted transcriptional regulator
MEVRLNTDLEAKLDQLALETGRPAGELVEDAIAGYLDEYLQAREMLNRRYDGLKSGRVKPIDGETLLEGLRQREEELIHKPIPR